MSNYNNPRIKARQRKVFFRRAKSFLKDNWFIIGESVAWGMILGILFLLFLTA